MWQEIVAGIIIILAVIYAGYKIFQFFHKKNDPCSGCSSECGSCEIAEIKKKIAKKNKK